jgi:8-oxo-dGTP pyrophosphatase MutT (NUDIX family)
MRAPEPASQVLRPRDAATLIIVDTARGEPRAAGRRRADLAFMPSRYVFPGGRVDPADGTLPSSTTWRPATSGT